jgi:hypothetical protein
MSLTVERSRRGFVLHVDDGVREVECRGKIGERWSLSFGRSGL